MASEFHVPTATPIAADTACTPPTQAKARSACGLSKPMTAEASAATASASAVTKSGPSTAAPKTSPHSRGVGASVTVRATARATTTARTRVGRSGRTPSDVPAMESGTWCTANHNPAIAPNVPVRSLLADTSVTRTTVVQIAMSTPGVRNATRINVFDWAGDNVGGRCGERGVRPARCLSWFSTALIGYERCTNVRSLRSGAPSERHFLFSSAADGSNARVGALSLGDVSPLPGAPSVSLVGALSEDTESVGTLSVGACWEAP